MANETPGIVCPNCGTVADTPTRFCPNCGAALTASPTMQAQQMQPPPVIAPGQPQQPWAMSPDAPQGMRQKPDGGKKVVGWVLGGCALVALLLLLGLLALCGFFGTP